MRRQRSGLPVQDYRLPASVPQRPQYRDPVNASARSFPARIWGAVEVPDIITGTSPATVADRSRAARE